MLSLTKWKLGLYLLKRLGLGKALGEAWKWILIYNKFYTEGGHPFRCLLLVLFICEQTVCILYQYFL